MAFEDVERLRDAFETGGFEGRSNFTFLGLSRAFSFHSFRALLRRTCLRALIVLKEQPSGSGGGGGVERPPVEEAAPGESGISEVITVTPWYSFSDVGGGAVICFGTALG